MTTTAAQIGVRGTNFWGGMLRQYGVFDFSGKVDVTAQGKTVGLAPGQGTDIPPGGAPGNPMTWSADKIAEALKTISFGPPGGGQPQEQPQQQQQQQRYRQQQQQQGGQQQATTPQPYTVGAAIPIVIGAGIVAGVFIGTTSGNDNDNNNQGRKRASP